VTGVRQLLDGARSSLDAGQRHRNTRGKFFGSSMTVCPTPRSRNARGEAEGVLQDAGRVICLQRKPAAGSPAHIGDVLRGGSQLTCIPAGIHTPGTRHPARG